MRLVTENMGSLGAGDLGLVDFRMLGSRSSFQITQFAKSRNPRSRSSAVLLSGGLDSAVLLAEEAHAREVQPIYVSVGLAWEAGRARRSLARFLASARPSANASGRSSR